MESLPVICAVSGFCITTGALFAPIIESMSHKNQKEPFTGRGKTDSVPAPVPPADNTKINLRNPQIPPGAKVKNFSLETVLSDYKNWLMTYISSPYVLSKPHLDNLFKLTEGKALTELDMNLAIQIDPIDFYLTMVPQNMISQ